MVSVLIVDDEPDIRELLSTIITKEGHVVLSAANVAEAWSLLAQGPAAAFVDIDIPGETGVEFVFKLRQSSATKDLPVVFVTAYPDRSRALQITGQGAVKVIAKPFRMEQIVGALHLMLHTQVSDADI